MEESGGPKIPFRLGRTDADSGETSPKVCRLPDADKGSRKNTIQHVRDVFYGKFISLLLYEYYIEIKSILTLQSINNVEKVTGLMIGRLLLCSVLML